MEIQLPLIDTYTPTLEQVHDKVNACTNCAYHQINTNRVSGEGSIEAKLLVIGQGPGKYEIEKCRPYVGSSGKLLRKYIKEGGISIKDVYLTNLIRCKNPEGKTILTSSVRRCREWLDDEVGLVKPELIVCLGGMATQEITNITTPISEVGGDVVTSRYGIPAFITFHPAYILRVDKRKYPEDRRKIEATVTSHWAKIKELL